MNDKNKLLPRLEDYLRAEGNLDGKDFTCPKCGKRSKLDVKGASLYSGADGRPRISCKKCGADFDVFGAAAAIHDLNEKTDFPRIVKRVAEVLGEPFEESPGKPQQPKTPLPRAATSAPVPDFHAQNADYMAKCRKDIGETDYLTKTRGLPIDVLTQYGIGYDAATRRVVWQYDNGATEGRATTQADAKNAPRYFMGTGQKRGLWNSKALKGARPVWIVEGVLDALSIIAAGGAAMAIGGKGSIRPLIDHFAHCGYKPTKPLLLALDLDAANEQNQLAVKLEEMGVACCDFTPQWKEKGGDANRALVENRDALAAEVKRGIEAAEAADKPKQPTANAPKSIGESKADFFEALKIARSAPKWDTPFKVLNSVLNGGLREGLYVFGAIPSLGKTTFVVQIADHIAECGNDVLYFSLEMGKWELVRKSISRHTFTKGQPMGNGEADYGAGVHCAVSARQIESGRFSRDFVANVQRAVDTYFGYAGHIWIKDDVGNIGIKEIENTAREHYARTGKAPVVVVDYMQIIPPDGEKELTEKQKIDNIVMAFKRISRDLHAPVVVISSINRASYEKRLTIDACKESGGIEYTCDFLAFLELTNGKDDETRAEAMKCSKREITLSIKKNRGGRCGGEILFDYHPRFNVFTEIGAKDDTDDEDEYNENFPVVEINYTMGGKA